LIETSQRIRLIGSPGSGIDELAENVSRHSNLNVISLNNFFIDNCSKKENDCQSLLNDFLRSEEWLIKGFFVKDWALNTIRDANMIILLKKPFLIRLINFFSEQLVKIFRKNFSYKKMTFELKLILSFKDELKDLLSSKHLMNKVVIFNSEKSAYEFFIKETAPDLFL